MATLYCAKCDYKMESKTMNKICPKCGLPMFVYDEYMEDLKTANEIESMIESETKSITEEISEKPVTPMSVTEEDEKKTDAGAMKKEDPEAKTDTEPDEETEHPCGYEEIISEGDEEEDESTAKKPIMKLCRDIDDGLVHEHADSKYTMDWNDEVKLEDGHNKNYTAERYPEDEEIADAAEKLLKKINRKKYIVAAVGTAAIAVGIVAAIRFLNRKDD